MQSNEAIDQLETLIGNPDEFEARAYDLMQTWLAAGIGVEAIEPVLRFLEAHPTLDLGSPGPLVHFVERFEAAVIALRDFVERQRGLLQ